MLNKIVSRGVGLELYAGIGFVVMWSSGFIGARLGTDQAPALSVLMWRFIVAGIILAAWWLCVRRVRLRLRDVAIHAVIGLLAQGLYLFGVFSSVQYGVSAGTSALITALQPIAAALLVGPILNERSSVQQWIGLIIGLLGVGLVVAGNMHGSSATPLWAYALSFMAMAGLVAATLIERKFAPEMALADALPIQCIATALLFCVLGVSSGHASVPHNIQFWMAIAWIVGLSTIGGYGFYWFNLSLGSVTRVSSLIYLTPPVTMVWAYGMFGDKIETSGWIGLVVCFAAVVLVRRGQPSAGR
jgi:drug/metabolite transporter (DMT)-like permease